ncbi:hypothetical protein BH23PAT1_BH23PAT1_5310 [soil metagenome]
MTKTTAKASKQNTRAVYALKAAVSLVAAYIFGSLAIDSGSYWHYLFTLVSVVLSVKFIVRALKGVSK